MRQGKTCNVSATSWKSARLHHSDECSLNILCSVLKYEWASWWVTCRSYISSIKGTAHPKIRIQSLVSLWNFDLNWAWDFIMAPFSCRYPPLRRSCRPGSRETMWLKPATPVWAAWPVWVAPPSFIWRSTGSSRSPPPERWGWWSWQPTL